MSPAEDPRVTAVLQAAQAGDPQAAAELLPLVYNELRQLARARMAHQPPGHTLQPTALVHEAYLRVAGKEDMTWQGRQHFFFAAARAMHDILVEQARRKAGPKHGGGRRREELDDAGVALEAPAAGRGRQGDPAGDRLPGAGQALHPRGPGPGPAAPPRHRPDL
jgi:RNA polymerase sigma factor (TIGR02999 family)